MTRETHKRDFLRLADLEPTELLRLLGRAAELKRARTQGPSSLLRGKILFIVFEKASTRTRVSFEVAMHELGGTTVVLDPSVSQIGRGEPVRDTARVLSRYGHAIVVRTFSHATALEFARHATVPVINGLTRRTHPCQLMADVMTFEEHRGAIAGKIVAWSGDGNNMA